MAHLKEENFYNPLDYILEDINNDCVRMDPDNKKNCVRTAHLVSAFLVSAMRKNDKVFDELFSRIDFVGSYYDGIRVKEPTSFNMNLIMKLPLIYTYIEVEEDFNGPFVTLDCNSAISKNMSGHVKSVFDTWINFDGYLLENKPRQWLESVLARTVSPIGSQIKVLDEYKHIHLRKIGPAYAVCVEDDGIDIIFAFTIEFPKEIPPPPAFLRHPEHAYPWIVVSDTVKKNVYGRTDELWRISFPGLEKHLIHNKQKLKYILRFLKAFRDAQTNIVIPSYFMTNLFLWEISFINNGKKPQRFWEKRTGFLFVYMLTKLHGIFELGRLDYYWLPNVNLLSNYNEDHLYNMKGQLKNIILKINNLISMNKDSELRDYMFKLYSN